MWAVTPRERARKKGIEIGLAQWKPDEFEKDMTNALLVIAVLFAVSGMFSMVVAESKGHSQAPWFFAGFFFGPIGLIAASGLGDKRMSRTLRRIAESQNVRDLPALEFEPKE